VLYNEKGRPINPASLLKRSIARHRYADITSSIVTAYSADGSSDPLYGTLLRRGERPGRGPGKRLNHARGNQIIAMMANQMGEKMATTINRFIRNEASPTSAPHASDAVWDGPRSPKLPSDGSVTTTCI
jgi:hypothetical protein